jgi:hypothetical protein
MPPVAKVLTGYQHHRLTLYLVKRDVAFILQHG